MTPLADAADWLRLHLAEGIGPEAARKLLAAFGLPSQIFSAEPAALRKLLTARQCQHLLAPPDQAQIDLTLRWLETPGNALVTLADSDYPQSLLHIADPPVLLYLKGRSTLLARPSIAVVGSRNATAQGMRNAEQFSLTLSNAGLCVVSGLALGIDTAAHQGSLHGRGGSIAVIGTGADIVYPARNRALAHRLAEAGCIVSEYPLGMPAIASNFPRRNRIISGLARGVLVIEAAERSGSLITARMAAEQGREVFAMPGSIHAPLAKGCHLLIKQGAKLVETAEDVLDELGLATSQRPPEAGSDLLASPLLLQVGFDPVDLDTLALRSGLDMATLTAALLPLELDSQIEMLPGGLVRRIA